MSAFLPSPLQTNSATNPCGKLGGHEDTDGKNEGRDESQAAYNST
jgi:hypothetical protein